MSGISHRRVRLDPARPPFCIVRFLLQSERSARRSLVFVLIYSFACFHSGRKCLSCMVLLILLCASIAYGFQVFLHNNTTRYSHIFFLGTGPRSLTGKWEQFGASGRREISPVANLMRGIGRRRIPPAPSLDKRSFPDSQSRYGFPKTKNN